MLPGLLGLCLGIRRLVMMRLPVPNDNSCPRQLSCNNRLSYRNCTRMSATCPRMEKIMNRSTVDTGRNLPLDERRGIICSIRAQNASVTLLCRVSERVRDLPNGQPVTTIQRTRGQGSHISYTIPTATCDVILRKHSGS